MQVRSRAEEGRRVQLAQLSDSLASFSIAQNPRILPEETRQFSLELDESERTSVYDVLGDCDLPPDLHDAAPSRRLQFLAGRFCAAQALRALGVADWQQQLRRDVNGGPAWPTGIAGSITHTDGFVSAAVARTTDVEAIGIDTEQTISEPHARSVASVIAWPIEVAAARACGLTRLEALTLVFSAKETIFKCLHPRVGQMFHFHDVRLVDVNSLERTFQARVVKPLSPAFPSGTLLEGRFDIHNQWIHTGMTLLAPQ